MKSPAHQWEVLELPGDQDAVTSSPVRGLRVTRGPGCSHQLTSERNVRCARGGASPHATSLGLADRVWGIAIKVKNSIILMKLNEIIYYWKERVKRKLESEFLRVTYFIEILFKFCSDDIAWHYLILRGPSISLDTNLPQLKKRLSGRVV